MSRIRILVLIAIISLGFGGSISAQKFCSVQPKKYSLGKILNWKNDTLWFEMTNTTSKPWFLLAQFYNQSYQVIYSKKPIQAGQKVRIGLLYYTDQLGPFDIEIPIYANVSGEAVNLKATGYIKSIDRNAFLSCPSIRRVPEPEVKDEELVQVFNADKKPEAKEEEELDDEFNFEDEFEDDDEEEVIVSEPTESPVSPKVIDNPDAFAVDDKPNNIVLVIDKSRSMNDEDKMTKLKSSMVKLVNALRDQDRITIITYSRVVKMMAEGESTASKDEILSRIDALIPDGGSYGGKAMEAAFEYAEKYYMKDGNNVIILATDGKFTDKDFSESKLNGKAKRKNTIRGISVSGIGYGKDPRALNFLEELALSGGGRFINVSAIDSGERLILSLVKDISRR